MPIFECPDFRRRLWPRAYFCSLASFIDDIGIVVVAKPRKAIADCSQSHEGFGFDSSRLRSLGRNGGVMHPQFQAEWMFLNGLHDETQDHEIDEPGCVNWEIYYGIVKSRPETCDCISDLRYLCGEHYVVESAYLLKWLTGWPAFRTGYGDVYVQAPDGVFWWVDGPTDHIPHSLQTLSDASFREAGIDGHFNEHMQAVCRDIIRSLGPGFKRHIVRVPMLPELSVALRSYAEAIAATLGVPLPENETKELYGKFVGFHKAAYTALRQEVDQARQMEARERGAATRAKNIAERLAAGLPAREPPHPLGNAGKPWTETHIDKLRKLWDASTPVAAIAGNLRRTEGAITARLVMLGLLTPEEAEALKSLGAAA